MVLINEQSASASGNRADITVNALHVTVANPVLGGPPLADVVISSSHADITCAGCSSPIGDFVTGGGWITGPSPSGARANFAVAGGMKNGAFWGHLSYIDHGAGGPKVKGTGVTAYTAPDPANPTLRHIEGTADIDGSPGTYAVDVADNGEPGRSDTFTIRLSTGHPASGDAIQLVGRAHAEQVRQGVPLENVGVDVERVARELVHREALVGEADRRPEPLRGDGLRGYRRRHGLQRQRPVARDSHGHHGGERGGGEEQRAEEPGGDAGEPPAPPQDGEAAGEEDHAHHAADEGDDEERHHGHPFQKRGRQNAAAVGKSFSVRAADRVTNSPWPPRTEKSGSFRLPNL